MRHSDISQLFCRLHEHAAERKYGFGRRGGFGGEFPGGLGRFGHERGGMGAQRERLFDHGDIKLVVLRLLSEKPSYGYQLIKTMEERLSGGYTPSAGAIYPTLTMLEEEGLASSSMEGGKKIYALTEEGKRFLEENNRRMEQLFDRLKEAGRGFERGRTPELMRAFYNLRGAVHARLSRHPEREQMQKIVEAIDAAAKAIDAL